MIFNEQVQGVRKNDIVTRILKRRFLGHMMVVEQFIIQFKINTMPLEWHTCRPLKIVNNRTRPFCSGLKQNCIFLYISKWSFFSFFVNLLYKMQNSLTS